MHKTILKLDALRLGYPGLPLGSPLNLALPQGTTLGILGSNGAGKSTLFKTLLGLELPLDGNYQWKESVTFGYVPQESVIDPLFPLTVEAVLTMGSQKDPQRMTEILNALEMEALCHHLFNELSGGQKQRVLLGRALLGNPQVLLLDEPFNSLDYAFRKKFMTYLEHWQKKENLSVLLIEHDINRIVNQVEWMILLGAQRSFAGPTKELMQVPTLSAVYEAPLHIHRENGNLQIHFL